MTTITNPADKRVQAVFLKGHLKLMSLGMKNSHYSGRGLLDKAEAITGKTYKRGQYDVAVQDLQALIDAT